MKFVRVDALHRLRGPGPYQNAVMFKNVDGCFNVLVKRTPGEDDDGEEMAAIPDDQEADFVVALVRENAESDEEREWERLVEMDPAGYMDEEEDCFVVDTFTLPPKGTPIQEDIAAKLQRAFDTAVCLACRTRFVRDGGAMCVACELTSTEEAMTKEFCVVCQSEGPRATMFHVPCCQQPIHKPCLQGWQKDHEQCPMCRATTDEATAVEVEVEVEESE